MSLKRIFGYLLKIFLMMFLLCPAIAEIKKLGKFKGIEIPFNLKHENSIIEKGKYDFEIEKHQIQQMYYLRIRKKGKAICIIPGQELKYESSGYYEKLKDPNIPDLAKLRFKKIPEEKIVNIIFESGKRTKVYPCIKLRFRMEYEQ